MSFENQTSRTSATGSGAVGQAIPFSFPVGSSSDLTCYKRVTATGVQTDLAETTDYTVVVTGSTGGTITTVTAIETTEQFHAVRTTPQTQTEVLTTGGPFSATINENAFDKQTRIAIDVQDRANRSIGYPATDPTSSIGDIPNSIDRANKILTFGADGKPTASSSVDSTTITVSAFAETYLDDADAQTTMATLQGVGVFNVLNTAYGATGDGATDDEVAIEAAITAAAVSGGTVYFPTTGNAYKFLTAITVPANVSLEFAPGASLMGDGSSTLTVSGSIIDTQHQIFQSTMTAVPSGQSRFVRPEWFGAVGDGTTDDSAAMQAAVTAMNAGGGGDVLLNSSIYDMSTTTLNMATDVNLIGVGRETSDILYDGTAAAITIDGAARWSISDLKIQCTHDDSDGINITNASDYGFLTRLDINNDDATKSTTGAGIVFTAGTSTLAPTMTGIKIASFKYGINAPGASVTKMAGLDCVFIGQGDGTSFAGSAGIYLANDSDGVGNTFVGGTIEGYAVPIQIEAPGSSRVSLNWLGGDFEDNESNVPLVTEDWNGIIFTNNSGLRMEQSTNASANVWYRSHHYSSDTNIIETYNDQIFSVTNGAYRGAGVGALAFNMSGSMFNATGGVNITADSTAYPQGGFVGQGGHTNATNPDAAFLFSRDRKLSWASAIPTTGAWLAGSVIFDTVMSTGEPVGWICTASGTFGTATEACTATNLSAVVTCASTAGFYVNDWVDVSAQFPGSEYKIISIVPNTSITLDTAANGSGAVTVSTSDPTFVKFGYREDDVVRLLSTTTVALNANGDTTLYTVPTGKRCILHYAKLVAGADAGTSDISIGQNTAETDFVGVTNLDNLDAQYDAVLLAPVPSATPATLKSYAATTVIEAQVANQAGGATNTLYLYGTLY